MLKRWPRSTPGGRATFACRAERKRRRAHSPAYGWEPSGHAALYLDLAEVNGGPRAGRLRRVHLFEDRARVAHLLLRLEVADEDALPVRRRQTARIRLSRRRGGGPSDCSTWATI